MAADSEPTRHNGPGGGACGFGASGASGHAGDLRSETSGPREPSKARLSEVERGYAVSPLRGYSSIEDRQSLQQYFRGSLVASTIA